MTLYATIDISFSLIVVVFSSEKRAASLGCKNVKTLDVSHILKPFYTLNF